MGKIREKFYLQGINEYVKRLQPYVKTELMDGLEEKITSSPGEKEIERILHKEGEKILHTIGNDEIVVALDIEGKKISSEELAQKIEKWNLSGKNRVNLVVGGSYGLSSEVKKRADERISFSAMTFPHQMAVLILSEQIYRGFRIIRGEPYHK